VDFYFKEIHRVEASREIHRITSLLYDILVEYVDKRIEAPIIEDPNVSTPTSTSDSLSPKKDLLKKIAKIGMLHIRRLRRERLA